MAPFQNLQLLYQFFYQDEDTFIGHIRLGFPCFSGLWLIFVLPCPPWVYFLFGSIGKAEIAVRACL